MHKKSGNRERIRSRKNAHRVALLAALTACLATVPGTSEAQTIVIPGDDVPLDYIIKPIDPSDNIVTINDGAILRQVYGSEKSFGEVHGNQVFIKGGIVAQSVFGGRGPRSSRNSVEISDGQIGGNVYSGFAFGGQSLENKLSISGGKINNDVIGGYGSSASSNKVFISDCKKARSVIGGYGTSASNNTVSIVGTSEDGIFGDVYGNWASNDALGDKKIINVSISGGKIGGNVYGGYGKTAYKHIVDISGGTIDGTVIGGYSSLGTVEDNSVKISGGTLNNLVVGGKTKDDNATGNSVFISGDNTIIKSNVMSGWGDKSASGNTLILDGGDFKGGNDEPTEVIGGYVELDSLPSEDHKTTENTVVLGSDLKGKTLNAYIYGGRILAPEEYDEYETEQPEGYKEPVLDEVSGNTLEIHTKGVTVPSINNFENYYFILPEGTGPNETVLTVTGGRTVLAKKANIGVAIAGGQPVLQKNDQINLIKNNDGFTGPGNTDNKEDYKLQQGKDYEQVSLKGKNLHIEQGISLTYEGFKLDNDETTIYAYWDEEAKQEEEKQEEQKQEETKKDDKKQEEAKKDDTKKEETKKEETKKDDKKKEQEETKPEPVINPEPEKKPAGTAARVRPQTKAVVESRLAALASVNSGADLVAGQAMHNALIGASAAKGLSAGDSREGVAISPFVAVSGGVQRLESGSHVDVSGINAVVGIAARKDFEDFGLTAGAFFEFGSSRFNTHNGFDSGDVDGKGHATYTGAGILARLDITDTLLKGLYIEGSFRFGGIKDDWKTDDLRDAATGRRASFDLYSAYHGAHAGLGYIWDVSEAFKLDFYAKWFWTHLYGDDTHVALDPFEFKDIDSHRLRAGVRADWAVSEQFGIYAGAAYEREFDSKARATAYGIDTPSPTIKGDTGVFDVGFTFKPTSLPDFKMELGATATAGKRHGVSGNLMLKYEF